jgi:hypothetical protein
MAGLVLDKPGNDKKSKRSRFKAGTCEAGVAESCQFAQVCLRRAHPGGAGQISVLRSRALSMSITMTVTTTMMTWAAVSPYWKLRMLS